MAKADADLISRFDEPVTDNDIKSLAKLTRLNINALRVAAGIEDPEGAASVANGAPC